MIEAILKKMEEMREDLQNQIDELASRPCVCS